MSAVAAVLLAGALAACGSASTSSPSAGSTTTSTSPSPTPASTSAAPTKAPVAMPACARVWVAGKKLPGAYQGCTSAGQVVAAHARTCESGQSLVVFGNHFFAVKSGKIFASQDARNDAGYKAMLQSCGG